MFDVCCMLCVWSASVANCVAHVVCYVGCICDLQMCGLCYVCVVLVVCVVCVRCVGRIVCIVYVAWVFHMLGVVYLLS